MIKFFLSFLLSTISKLVSLLPTFSFHSHPLRGQQLTKSLEQWQKTKLMENFQIIKFSGISPLMSSFPFNASHSFSECSREFLWFFCAAHLVLAEFLPPSPSTDSCCRRHRLILFLLAAALLLRRQSHIWFESQAQTQEQQSFNFTAHQIHNILFWAYKFFMMPEQHETIRLSFSCWDTCSLSNGRTIRRRRKSEVAILHHSLLFCQ